MGSVMEVYFSQNQDVEYLQAVEKDIFSYIDKCDKRMLGSFSILKDRLDNYKIKPMEKVNKTPYEDRIESVIDALHDGEENSMRKAVRMMLNAGDSQTEFYLSGEGDIYIKNRT